MTILRTLTLMLSLALLGATDISGTAGDAPLVSVAELQSNGAAYDGKRITIEGFLWREQRVGHFTVYRGGPYTHYTGDKWVVCAFKDEPGITVVDYRGAGALAARMRAVRRSRLGELGMKIRATGIFKFNPRWNEHNDEDDLPISNGPNQPRYRPKYRPGVGELRIDRPITITPETCIRTYW